MMSLYLPVLQQVLMIEPNPLPVCISLRWLKSKHRQGNNTIISSDLHIVDSLGLRMKVKTLHIYVIIYTAKFLAINLMEVESTNV